MIDRPGSARRRYPVVAVAVALLLVGSRGLAQDPATGEARATDGSGWTFHIDNDVLYSRYNEDRNYTGGFGFEYAWSDPDRLEWLTRPVRALDRWTSWLGPPTEGGRTYYSALFATTAFTPEDLRSRAPIPDDRPYASLFFASTRALSVNPDEDFARTSEFAIGILGLPIAGEVQAFVHEYITPRSPDPMGWDNQISDGGEPTAWARVAANKLLKSAPAEGPPRFQLAWQAEAALGYQTYAGIGSTVRFGKIRSPFWGFDPNPLGVGTRKAPTQEPEPEMRKKGRRKSKAVQELYLFAAVEGSGVVYNVALQGQFRDSKVTFDASQVERFVYELHGGVSIRLWRTTITYALHFRGPEYKGPMARRHVWAGLYVSRPLS